MAFRHGLRSIGHASALLVMEGLQQVAAHPDRLVVRTPAEPDFWFGNYVLFRDGTVDPDAQLARFAADHPQARHVVLCWDDPMMRPGPGHDALRAAGLEIETDDVLTLDGVPQGPKPPDGIALRRIETDADWAQVVELHHLVDLEQGYPPEPHAAYVRRRFAQARRQVERGLGARFGAFDGDLLVADMGVFHDDEIARYQEVATRPSHRRRGLAAALVAHTGAWARRRAPGATLVIIAEAGGPAGRIYRRCGFAPAETLVSALRPGYAA